VGLKFSFTSSISESSSYLTLYTSLCQEYERLEAQLDGARSPLAKKVQSFALTGSKIPLVEEAERHAELLNALAKNLSR